MAVGQSIYKSQRRHTRQAPVLNEHSQILPVSHLRFPVNLTSKYLRSFFYWDGNPSKQREYKADGRNHPAGLFSDVQW